MASHAVRPWQAPTLSSPHLRLVVVMAILAVSGQFHRILWPVVPPDFALYQFVWFDHLVRQGPVDAFAQPFSNYSPPYLYLLALASLAAPWLSPFTAIKMLSVAITAWLGFATYRCAKAAGAGESAIAGASVLLLPTVVLNGAMLGQCDALWVAPLMLALAALLEENAARCLCGSASPLRSRRRPRSSLRSCLPGCCIGGRRGSGG